MTSHQPPRPRRAGKSRLGRPSQRDIYAMLAIACIIVLAAGIVIMFILARNATRDQNVVGFQEKRPTATAAPTLGLGGVVIIAPTEPAPVVGPPVWDGSGRVNLLVLGIDQRGSQQGYFRTDTMIIVTIDPQAQTVGMISIPRDLWVPIWGYENKQNRINTAHYYGDVDNYPGGGPALARDTASYNLGIPIHHYARINFTVFEHLIDEIGGIDIYAEQAINDPAYPDEGTGYDPFYMPAGQHHLDGKTALKYARTRHGGSDFERARRQQQVILAARDQVLNLNQMPRLIANGPQILSALGDSVQTDLSFDQAKQLAEILQSIPADSYRGAVIDQHYTQPYVTDTGAQVLIPLREKIGQLYSSFFETP